MIKYRTLELGQCISEAELDAQWSEGYELVSATCNGNVIPPEYCYIFAYKGGIRAPRSTIGRGS